MNKKKICVDCSIHMEEKVQRCPSCKEKHKKLQTEARINKIKCKCGKTKSKTSIQCAECREATRNKGKKIVKKIPKKFLERGNVSYSSGMQFGVEL